jgi:RNA polymerase sigma-70 factor (ECF subfamily)
MDVKRDEFWRLVEPEHQKALAFCRKLAGNREDGDDLYQDSLVCALSGFNGLRKRSAFRPWLYRIIINNFRSIKRSSLRDRVRPIEENDLEIPGHSDISAEGVLRRRLEAALAEVSPENRAVLILYAVEGWQISEIAAMFGRSQGSIRTRLSRTRNKMRKTLMKYLQRSQTTSSKKTVQSEEAICVAVRSGEE